MITAHSLIGRRLVAVAIAVTFLLMSTWAPAAADTLRVVAQDGTYLGEISCGSIGDRFSEYGNKFSATSIWNKFSQYGSPYAAYSAFNKFTTTPPEIYDGEDMVGYLSTNKYLTGTVVSPIALELQLMDQCNQDQPYM